MAQEGTRRKGNSPSMIMNRLTVLLRSSVSLERDGQCGLRPAPQRHCRCLMRQRRRCSNSPGESKANLLDMPLLSGRRNKQGVQVYQYLVQ